MGCLYEVVPIVIVLELAIMAPPIAKTVGFFDPCFFELA